jgi:hypothetical protein
MRSSRASLRGAADGIAQNHHSVTELPLLNEFEFKPHAVGEEPLSAADDHRVNDHEELVDETCVDRLPGELRTSRIRSSGTSISTTATALP